jgi:hypothetical protein
MVQKSTPNTNENLPIEVPKKSYQVYNMLSQKNSANSVCSTTESEGSILMTIYNNTNARRADSVRTPNTDQSFEMGNAWMQPLPHETIHSEIPINRHATLPDFSMSKVSNIKATNQSFDIKRQLSHQENVRAFSTPPFNTDHFSVLHSPSEKPCGIDRDHSFTGRLYNFRDWTRLYLFGREHDTGMPRIRRRS